MRDLLLHWFGGLAVVSVLLQGLACSAEPDPLGAGRDAAVTETLRIASFNTALSRETPGALREAITAGNDAKVAGVVEVLRRVRPDVVLLLEVDHGAGEALRDRLALPDDVHEGLAPIVYRFVYEPEVNTGQPSGHDLDRDGKVQGPGDAYGWGNYPGHYGFVLLSNVPIDAEAIRTFRTMRWLDLPEHVMPAAWYGDVADHVRLSSKTHADVPIVVDGPDGRPHRLHLLLSHPTPPVFDGPEDRNGKRNHDEVALWSRYLDGEVLADDAGVVGSLDADASAVVLGDLNADPHDGDSFGEALRQLLEHPRLDGEAKPRSDGAVQASVAQGGMNAEHRGPAELDTADFPDAPPRGPGNLRVDYVLPPRGASGWAVSASGVFWPADGEPGAEASRMSDHRLVWVDLKLPELPGAEAQ